MQLIRNDAEITDVILQRWKVLFTFYNRIRATLLTGNLLEGADYRVHVKQLFNIRNIDSIHIQDALRRCSDMRNNLLNNQTRGPTTKATFFIANSISKALAYIEHKLNNIKATNNGQHHLVRPPTYLPAITHFPYPTAYDFYVETTALSNTNPSVLTDANTYTPIRNVVTTPTPPPSSNNINTDIRIAVHELDEILLSANGDDTNHNLLTDLLAEDPPAINDSNHTASESIASIVQPLNDQQVIIHASLPIPESQIHSAPSQQPSQPPQPALTPLDAQSQDQPLPASPLDEIPIQSFFLCPLQTATTIDIKLGDTWCTVFTLITDQIFEAISDNSINQELKLERAFKLYGGIPQLFFRTNDSDHPDSTLIRKRFMQFITGNIEILINSWKRDIVKFERKRNNLSTADLNKKKKKDAEKLKVRAISLINSGFIRRGVSQLESLGVAPINNPSIIQQMRNKHPQIIDNWEEFTPMDPDAFQIDCLIPLIRTLDTHKGTGPRSFKNDYLIKLVTSKKLSDISQRAVNNLLKLGKYYLSGTIPEKYRLLLSGGLLTPLIKKTDNNGNIEARPVKAEDADTSIFCRALS
jgi:hypothetical protein